MPDLAASFPEEERAVFVKRSFRAGVVLYLECSFTNPPKDKFVILAADDDPPLLILINSRIHRFISKHPKLLQCQVILSPSDYNFLRQDSYADCSQVYYSMSQQEIISQLVTDASRIKSRLTHASTQRIIAAIQRAQTLSRLHVRRIISDLQ